MFRKVATKISTAMGHPIAFVIALLVVITWAASGPIFDFSNTWQLIINTGTTITTFLMVFLIQNTQNRDTKAVQLKLDELLLSTRGRDAFVDLEDMSDDELAELDREFRAIHEKQSSSAVMKRLHAKVEAEKSKRQNKNIFSGINPLNHDKK